MSRVQSAVVVTGILIAVAAGVVVARWRARTAKRAISSTMMDIYSIRAALNQYAAEHKGLLPPPIASDPDLASWDAVMVLRVAVVTYPTRKARWLQPYLQKYFSRAMPELDAWGRPLLAGISQDRRSYILVSLGSDGEPTLPLSPSWPAAEWQHDLVFFNDTFISAPEGWAH